MGPLPTCAPSCPCAYHGPTRHTGGHHGDNAPHHTTGHQPPAVDVRLPPTPTTSWCRPCCSSCRTTASAAACAAHGRPGPAPAPAGHATHDRRTRHGPTIRTSCPAATRDYRSGAHRWAGLARLWPSSRRRLLQLSTTVLPTGQHVALVDLYRADAQVLVRCDAEHLQDLGSLGTTLQDHTQHLEQQIHQLQQVAADAEALLDALDGVQLDDLPAVVLAPTPAPQRAGRPGGGAWLSAPIRPPGPVWQGLDAPCAAAGGQQVRPWATRAAGCGLTTAPPASCWSEGPSPALSWPAAAPRALRALQHQHQTGGPGR